MICPTCGYSAPGTAPVCPRCARPLALDPGVPAAPYGGPGSTPYAPAASAPAPGVPLAGHGAPGSGVASGHGYGYGSAPAARLPSSAENPYAPPAPGAGPAPPGYAYAYAFASDVPSSGWAVASLVVGIVSILLYPFAIITGPLAIIFFYLARRQIAVTPPTHKGMGMAIAGLVTGIIGSLLGLLVVIGVVAFLGAFRAG